MEDFKVHHSKQLADSPAFDLVLKAKLALLKKGFTDRYNLSDFYEVVYTTEKNSDKPLGVLVFTYLEDKPVCWIVILWIEPKYRKKGISKLMTTHLKKVLKKRKEEVLFIELGTNTRNKRMHKVAQKLNFQPLWTTFRKDLN